MKEMQKRQQSIKHALVNKVIRASPELKRSDSSRLLKHLDHINAEKVSKNFRDEGRRIIELEHRDGRSALQARINFNKEKDTRRIPPTGRERLPKFEAGAAAGTVNGGVLRVEPGYSYPTGNPARTARQVRRERKEAWKTGYGDLRLGSRSAPTLGSPRAQPRSASY
ncbi:hypothetical protein OAI84_00420 [bacterium]|nr:hypothetical protein [bacterium]